MFRKKKCFKVGLERAQRVFLWETNRQAFHVEGPKTERHENLQWNV